MSFESDQQHIHPHLVVLISVLGERIVDTVPNQNSALMLMKQHGSRSNSATHWCVFNGFWTARELCGTEGPPIWNKLWAHSLAAGSSLGGFIFGHISGLNTDILVLGEYFHLSVDLEMSLEIFFKCEEVLYPVHVDRKQRKFVWQKKDTLFQLTQEACQIGPGLHPPSFCPGPLQKILHHPEELTRVQVTVQRKVVRLWAFLHLRCKKISDDLLTAYQVRKKELLCPKKIQFHLREDQCTTNPTGIFYK